MLPIGILPQGQIVMRVEQGQCLLDVLEQSVTGRRHLIKVVLVLVFCRDSILTDVTLLVLLVLHVVDFTRTKLS